MCVHRLAREAVVADREVAEAAAEAGVGARTIRMLKNEHCIRELREEEKYH